MADLPILILERPVKKLVARPVAARCVIAACGLVLGVGAASGHDDDWRKLIDRVPAVEGPIWRLGDPVTRDGGFDASGVTCLSHLPLNTFGLGSASGNDCWGYVSPSGREYAIMGLQNGFGFVEITDPVNPVIVASIPGPDSLWHDVKVIGHYAYGVSEGGAGIQVMNMANIDAGVVTLVRNSQQGGHSTTHNIVSNEETGTLWLVGANIGNGGLVHLDLTDPTRPMPSGGWTQMYVHDAQVVTMQAGPWAGREIAFCSSGFSGGFSSTGLRIVDVTNPASPVVLSTLFYPNSAYSHQCWLSEDQQYLYLNDELDEDSGFVPTTTTRIINVSSLTSPSFAGTFTSGRPAIDHNLYTHQGHIFEANYRSGLRVFNAANPLAPVEVAYFDTFPGSDGLGFNGAWSVYPYFPSGNVIVSDIERGLFVLRVDALDLDRLDLGLAGEAPDVISPDGGDTLSVTIDEVNLTADLSTLGLVFDDGSGPVTVPAVPSGGNSYTFTFPAADCGEATYYVTVDSTLGETFTLPATAPSFGFTSVVADAEVVEFTDNFEANLGWTVSGPVPNAGAGRWERAIPGGDGSRGDPANDFDGSGRCYVTGNGGPGSNTDVDGGATILTSPAFDVSAAPEARVSYARWFDNTGSGTGANPGVETFLVQISNNNGSTWSTLETVGPAGPGSSGGWILAEHRIADYVTPTASVRVRFTAKDDIGAVIEAGVDRFEVAEYLCEPAPDCPPDIDGNGILNLDDLDAFITAFFGGDLGVDLDGNGTLNLDDLDLFVTLFSAGCP